MHLEPSGKATKIRMYSITLFAILLTSLVAFSPGRAETGPSQANPNPYLSSPLYGITHFDSSQSDSTPYGPPAGVFRVDLAMQPISYGGPVNIITLASTNPDTM